MVPLVIFLAILVPLLLAGAFLLGRSWRTRAGWGIAYSPVTRQHFEIFQTGHMNEAAVEAAKVRFRELLDQGDVATVEASLRPGMHYIFQVRALAEIGTESAGLILERQLQRRLTEDKFEQAWYWIDLASGLRSLHREESLPQLLRCAESAIEVPLGPFFAAEAICFLGFPSYLRQTDTSCGLAALRLLHRALEGLRSALQPILVTESRLGEILENLWEGPCPPGHPLLARVARECLRFLRRGDHARRLLAEDRAEQEAFDWQMSRLSAVEPVLLEYLEDAPALLLQRLDRAEGKELADILLALEDLRVEAGAALLGCMKRLRFPYREQAIAVLTWSKDSRIGPWLRTEARRLVNMERRARSRRRSFPPNKPSLPPEIPYGMILRALRGHPSVETEKFLALAARDWDPLFRVAALGSLGWWEPLHRPLVQASLQEGKLDPCFEVRHAARAALARLGERQALHWFRQGLSGEDPHYVHEAINFIAAENLFLLWPDLDSLADSPNQELAHFAREALERLCEEMDWSK